MANETRIAVPDDPIGSNSPLGADDELVAMLMNEEQRERTNHMQVPKIPRVPRMLSVIESNQECYDPLMVSIGPYHNEKPELQETKSIKITMLRQFVQISGKSISELYNKVEEVAKEINAKQYYDEDAIGKLDDKKFIQIMVLDGCFIIQFISCLLHDTENLKMNSHAAAMVARDLFLLENQVPFPILKALMSLRFKEQDDEEGMELLKDFIKHIRAVPPRRESCRERISKFFRKKIMPGALSSTKSPVLEDYDSVHLLDVFHKHFIGKEVEIDRSRTSWYRYRPAMELRRVGIHFKPSKTSQFTDVRFKQTWLAGRLQLPPLTIHDSTKSLLLNLVAYEACLGSGELWITSYICFMDSLIDHPEDVRELRSKGILLNTLGSDEEVAKLFNEIANYLVPNPYAFAKVKKGIESHYSDTFKRWILHYKGPVYTVIFKYSFIFGLLLTALKAVKVLPIQPLYGVCRLPDSNITQYP